MSTQRFSREVLGRGKNHATVWTAVTEKNTLPDMCKKSRRQSCLQKQFSGFHTWHKSIHVLVSFHEDLIILNFVCRWHNPLKRGGNKREKLKQNHNTKTQAVLFSDEYFQSYIIPGLQHRFKKWYRCLVHEPVFSSKIEMYRDPQATQKAEAKYLHQWSANGGWHCSASLHTH